MRLNSSRLDVYNKMENAKRMIELQKRPKKEERFRQ